MRAMATVTARGSSSLHHQNPDECPPMSLTSSTAGPSRPSEPSAGLHSACSVVHAVCRVLCSCMLRANVDNALNSSSALPRVTILSSWHINCSTTRLPNTLAASETPFPDVSVARVPVVKKWQYSSKRPSTPAVQWRPGWRCGSQSSGCSGTFSSAPQATEP